MTAVLREFLDADAGRPAGEWTIVVVGKDSPVPVYWVGREGDALGCVARGPAEAAFLQTASKIAPALRALLDEVEGLRVDAESWRKLGLVYEDQLPEMTDAEYSKWYEESSLIYGVRMGPAIRQP